MAFPTKALLAALALMSMMYPRQPSDGAVAFTRSAPSDRQRSGRPLGGFMSRAVTKRGPLLYISVPESGEIDVYPAVGKFQSPIGKITGLTGNGGIAVDRGGNLWVYQDHTITAFARGSLMPFRTLTALPGGSSLAIDRSGSVYAAGPNNIIAIYRHGSSVPTAALTDTLMTQLWAIAVDGEGNVFDNGTLSHGPSEPVSFQLDELPVHSGASIPLRTLGDVGGLAMGPGDSLVVQDSGFQTISVYPKPYLGQPSSSFVFGDQVGIAAMALTKLRRTVWTTVPVLNGSILGARFTLTGGTQLNTTQIIGRGYGSNGIAVDPVAL